MARMTTSSHGNKQEGHDGLIQVGVRAIVHGAVHLFDAYGGYEEDEGAKLTVKEGYDFLREQVGL